MQYSKSVDGVLNVNEQCIYLISISDGNFINLTIPNFNSGYSDFLEIRDGSTENSPLIGTFWGLNINISIQSTHNNLWIR